MDSAQNNRPSVARDSEFYPTLAPHVRRTPVISTSGSEFGLEPAPLALKLELLQHTGSFKARGAITNLLTKTRRAGVVAASGGNHGSRLRLQRGNSMWRPGSMCRPLLVSPKSTAFAGTARNGDWWRALRRCYAESQNGPASGRDGDSRVRSARNFARRGRLTRVRGASARRGYFARRGGGGGLIAHCSVVCRQGPHYWRGAGSSAHVDASAGSRAPVDAEAGGIAAIPLRQARGRINVSLAQQFVERVLLVTDEEIRQAQQSLWKEMRIAAEPAGRRRSRHCFQENTNWWVPSELACSFAAEIQTRWIFRSEEGCKCLFTKN